MELKDFQCCKVCNRIEKCPAPCSKFLDSIEMDKIDKGVFDRSMRVDERMQSNHARKARKEFLELKNTLLSTIQLKQEIKFAEGNSKSSGRVIQVTDVFIVLKSISYVKNINFRDVFTKDVILG